MSDDPVARHREKVLVNLAPTFVRYNSKAINGTCTSQPYPTTVASTTGRRYVKYRKIVMDDFVVPRFKRRMKQGEIFNNYALKTDVNEEWFPGSQNLTSILQKWGCTPARWYDYIIESYVGAIDSELVCNQFWTKSTGEAGSFMTLPVISAAELDSIKSQAITSAYAAINATDVMALVSLAESEKSMKGLLSTFVRVGRILGRLAYNLRKFKNVTTEDLTFYRKQILELYMEARYGLRPLYYDVMGFAKFVESRNSLTKDRITFRGRQGREVYYATQKAEMNLTLPTTGPYYMAYVSATRTCKIDVSARAGVLTSFKDYEHVQGLGLDLLAETAWELVPFSFIVDWFFNVGQLIQSWTPNIGFTSLSSWVTVETTATRTFLTGSTRYVDAQNTLYRNVGQCHELSAGGVRTNVTRERIPKPQRPISPRFRMKLDPLKLLDLAIILTHLKGVKTLVRKLRV